MLAEISLPGHKGVESGEHLGQKASVSRCGSQHESAGKEQNHLEQRKDMATGDHGPMIPMGT